MVHYLRTSVVSLEEHSVILELPNGDRLEWPRASVQADPKYLATVRVGEELTITLTHTTDLINELLLRT